jgi:hypothetical protein
MEYAWVEHQQIQDTPLTTCSNMGRSDAWLCDDELHVIILTVTWKNEQQAAIFQINNNIVHDYEARGHLRQW